MRKLIKRAIAYYRQNSSTKNVGDRNSIAAQRKRVEKFAKKHGIKIIHEIIDEGNGSPDSNQSSLQRLFEQWVLNKNAPDFDYVILADASRWGRRDNLEDIALYEYQCVKQNKQVVYADRGLCEGDTQIRHLHETVRRGMARERSLWRSARIREGIRRRRIEKSTRGCAFKTRFVLDLEGVTKKFLQGCDKGFSLQEERMLCLLRDSLNRKLAVK